MSDDSGQTATEIVLTRYWLYAFLVSGLINFICSITILRRLAESGVKVNFFEIRYQVHKHLKEYRLLVMQQTGGTPWIYYAYVGSLITTLGFALFTLLSLDH